MAPKRQQIAKKEVELSETETTTDETLYNIEYLVQKRKIRNRVEYLIKWEGYPEEENSWQYAKDIPADVIAEFEESRALNNNQKMKEDVTEKQKKTKKVKKEIKVESANETDSEEKENTAPIGMEKHLNEKPSDYIKLADLPNTDHIDFASGEILGVNESEGKLAFWMVFGNRHDLYAVDATRAYDDCTQEVIRFFEEHLVFH